MFAVRQGLRQLLAALFAMTSYNILVLDGDKLLSSFAFALALLCLVASRLSPRKAGWVSVSVWVGASSFALCTHSRGLLPEMAKRRLLLWTAVFIGCVINKACCAPVLPRWLLVVFSEFHAMSHWLVMSKLHEPWTELILAQVMVVALPAVLFYSTSKPAPESPSKATSAFATTTSAGGGTSDAQGSLARTNHTAAKGVHTPTVVPTSSAKPTHPVYQSVFGNRPMVCVKVATHHHPINLQPASLGNLVRAVERLGTEHGRYQGVVLGASVRYGCILISLDTRNLLPEGVSTFDARTYAQQLLPTLLNDLELSHKGGELSHGQFLCLQLGSHMVHATMDPAQRQWVFETRLATTGLSPPRLCLAHPCPAAHQPTSDTQAAVHLAIFKVQMLCDLLASCPMVVGSCPDQLRSPANPPSTVSRSMADMQHEQKPHVQLWVHCQGQYLQTSLKPLYMDASNSIHSQIQVTVHIPSSILARHHQPNGPVARLQLLTAELWDNNMLLSTTQLMLDAQEHLRPTPAQTSFGWWGASAASAAGMVREVASMTERVQALVVEDQTDAAGMQSHDAFVSDLSAWLVTMQQAAPITCCAVQPPSMQHHIGLKLDQCQALGMSLLKYAAQCKLTQTQALLCSQQCNLLTTWLEHTASNTSTNLVRSGAAQQLTVHSATDHFLRQVKRLWQQAACIKPCACCDEIYSDRLRIHFRHVNVLVCISCALLVVAKVYQPLTWLSCTWSISHVLSALCLLVAPGTWVDNISWLPWFMWRGGLQVVAWACHFTIDTGCQFDASHPDNNFCTT